MKYLILILILTGCSTAKELLDKAEKKDPAIVATYAREKYPCTDLLKPDTAVIWKDTTIYIDCPETTGSPFEVVIRDTVNKVVTKTVRVPVTMPVRTMYIDRWYEDSAKLKIYSTELNDCNKANENLKADNDKLQAKATRRGWENWIWRLIALTFVVLKLIKIYRKIMIKI